MVTVKKGTNTIKFMFLDEIQHTDTYHTVTYARIVCEYPPPKDNPNRAHSTVGGNIIDYPRNLKTCMVELISAKILWNIIISNLREH